MQKSFFKVFFSKIKENEWLNLLGKEGYLLEKISDSKYYFSQKEGVVYSYSIEHLDCPIKSEDAEAYFDKRRSENIFPIITSGRWIYFVAENAEIEMSTEIYRKNSVLYFWRTLYLMFFAIVGAVVCGYQVFAIDYLERLGYASDGLIDKLSVGSSGTSFDNTLDSILTPVNYVIDFINENLLVWIGDTFGRSDAIVILAFLVPIVVALFIIGAFNLDEYINYRIKISKKQNGSTTVAIENDVVIYENDCTENSEEASKCEANNIA